MTPNASLRPLERRVLRLLDEGTDEAEIARRFRRSPEMIRRVAFMAGLPRSASPRSTDEVLRPLERRVLRWREGGTDYGEIGQRFRRSPEHVQRVETLANYKLARS